MSKFKFKQLIFILIALLPITFVMACDNTGGFGSGGDPSDIIEAPDDTPSGNTPSDGNPNDTPSGNTPSDGNPDDTSSGNTPSDGNPDDTSSGNTPSDGNPDDTPSGNTPSDGNPDDTPSGNTPSDDNSDNDNSSENNPTKPLPGGLEDGGNIKV